MIISSLMTRTSTSPATAAKIGRSSTSAALLVQTVEQLHHIDRERSASVLVDLADAAATFASTRTLRDPGARLRSRRVATTFTRKQARTRWHPRFSQRDLERVVKQRKFSAR